jgi:hypothetical protein
METKQKIIMKHTDLLGFNQDIDIDNIIKEATCRQKSQELADSYSAEELQDRLDQIMRDMEQEAEPEGGPIADMYADEMDAYEGALKIAKGDLGKGNVPYDVAIGKMTQDEYDEYMSTVKPDRASFEKSSKFDRNLGEQGFDDRLANQMGMSDDEFEDQVASRDIGDGGSSFPGTNNVSPFAAKARDYIETFRQEYRDMSDDGIDEFSVEIINHLLDNTAAQAAAKIYFGKKGL